ncbi:Pr6Pr family membrane protein [Rhodococcus tukisamuensis]|uniref:FAR-17a/AIG1-like protein n=1 Tax=Rhodococcus tukisamuensis TaxID=168276 RepID=A0A1G6R037_9NOCA|nr:Pr6Pr family membrane protein [Rhodococcus tukisamuensis]SDC97861.1 FAR-17a/AIG1-like protein [Rhodococcus tukisamuensis]
MRALRLAFAALGVVALAWIPIREIDSDSFSVVNYFSYFTILSNVLTVVVFAVGGLTDPQSRRWQLFRGATTLYMVITGIIYAVLLAGIDVNLNDDWINNSLHRILPLVILLDWLVNPPRMRISDKQAVGWLWFPLVYGVYSLIRGAVVDWYPYPFLSPMKQGYLQMSIGLVVLLLAFVLMALAVNAAGRLARRRRYGKDIRPLTPAEIESGEMEVEA